MKIPTTDLQNILFTSYFKWLNQKSAPLVDARGGKRDFPHSFALAYTYVASPSSIERPTALSQSEDFSALFIMFTSHDIVTSIQLSTKCNLTVCIFESIHNIENLTASCTRMIDNFKIIMENGNQERTTKAAQRNQPSGHAQEIKKTHWTPFQLINWFLKNWRWSLIQLFQIK